MKNKISHIAIIVLLLITSSINAQVAKPIVRAKVLKSTVIVGEPVEIKVSVVVPTWLLGSPEFPTLEIPGAISTLPDVQAENVYETIDYERWSGIARTYLVYPQEAKSYTLPNASVGVTYSLGGIEKSPKTNVKIPQVKFKAVIPESARSLEYFISTTQLKIEQELDKKLTKIRVGDSFQREITISTKNSLAMFIPSLQIDEIDGLKIYFDEPIVENKKKERVGITGGERIEKITYFIEKPGDYQLPEIKIDWWNLKSKEVVSSTLKAIEFYADSNTNYISELSIQEDSTLTALVKEESKHNTWNYLLWTLIIALLLFIEKRFRIIQSIVRKIKNWLRKREELKRESETEYFKRFREACDENNLAEIKTAFSNWLDRISINENWSDVRELSEITNNTELLLNAQKLDEILFGKDGKEINWNKSDFLQQVKASRKEFLKIKKMKAESRRIPPLNP